MPNNLNPLFAVVIITLLAAAWQNWMNRNFDYQCANCDEVFSLSLSQAMLAPHFLGRKLVRCPRCGKISWAAPVRK
jgi:hypothetical protein